MVRGLLPAANVAVDDHAGQAVGGLRREQQVVDADAVVPLPGPGLIVPEGVAAGAPSAAMIGVGQAQPFSPRKAARV